MTIDVKICGLSTAETVAAAVSGGAAFLGFVLVPASPRAVTPEQARALMDTVEPGAVQSVALLADASDAVIETVLARLRPDWLQLHGTETPERVAAVKARFDVPVIKAIGIAGPQDVATARGFTAVADRVLLDAKPQDPGGLRGGQGLAFDWTLVQDARLDRPWFLAGGLDAATVAEAVTRSGAPAVDVSSGVERARGVKAAAKITAFLAAAHGAAPARGM